MGRKADAEKVNGSWSLFLIAMLSASALILLLISYQSTDPSLNTLSTKWDKPKNLLGYFGSWTADILFQLFGWCAWILPTALMAASLRWAFTSKDDRENPFQKKFWASLGLVLAGSALFTHIQEWKGAHWESYPTQGLLGLALSAVLVPLVGKIGSYFAVLVMLWSAVFVWWDELPIIAYNLFKKLATHSGALAPYLLKMLPSKPSFSLRLPTLKNKKANSDEDENEDTEEEEDKVESVTSEPSLEPIKMAPQPELIIRAHDEKAQEKAIKKSRATNAQSEEEFESKDWELPPISLLTAPLKKSKGPSEQQLKETARKIVSSLKSFDIEGVVTEVSPGPIITLYEFQPAPGTRVQKIVSVSTDLAMALGAPAVRILAPIPGKSVAGIEVPNIDQESVLLRDVYENTIEKAKGMKLPIAIGKDAEGRPITEDLSRMPHLLIGGATGMGKSVLINSLLTGLLCRYSPENLRLIVVDPKLVEFRVYEDIPHLLLPIVNDPIDASRALKWAVQETKRRYALMQKFSVKNIEGYNLKVPTLSEKDWGEGMTEAPKKFPYLLIVIDELADLLITGRKDVEQSIVRLTQLARAAGIHLLMATQRPSADVVTGLIKSNCPARVALRVASPTDSRIILDCSGAEQLLGRGDLFFTNTGPMGLKRVQSCYVSDQDIEKVCDFWRSQGEPSYKEEILEEGAKDPDQLDDDGRDDRDVLYTEVVSFAREKGKISTSLIQRRFSIGYSRAARIMEQLESAGMVAETSVAGKPRDVLL